MNHTILLYRPLSEASSEALAAAAECVANSVNEQAAFNLCIPNVSRVVEIGRIAACDSSERLDFVRNYLSKKSQSQRTYPLWSELSNLPQDIDGTIHAGVGFTQSPLEQLRNRLMLWSARQLAGNFGSTLVTPFIELAELKPKETYSKIDRDSIRHFGLKIVELVTSITAGPIEVDWDNG